MSYYSHNHKRSWYILMNSHTWPFMYSGYEWANVNRKQIVSKAAHQLSSCRKYRRNSNDCFYVTIQNLTPHQLLPVSHCGRLHPVYFQRCPLMSIQTKPEISKMGPAAFPKVSTLDPQKPVFRTKGERERSFPTACRGGGGYLVWELVMKDLN